MKRPITIFYVYAERDEALRQQLEMHLALLRRQKVIAGWEPILAGAPWAEKMEQVFEEATLILLLVSADFLDSDVCYEQQMQRALERHVAGKAQVIPILVRSCDWSDAPFAHLQVLPTHALPITAWPDQDAAWADVVTGIRHMLSGQPMPSWEKKLTIPDPMSTTSSLSPTHAQSLSTLEKRNRARFLAKLHNRYSEIVQYSLQGTAQIALELHSKSEAVLNHTRLRLRQPNIPEHPLPVEMTLLQVFDDTSGELLVLGNPGAGKTTLLLNLAEGLYQRALYDEHALIPVIVNLSTWTTTRKPLAEWFIEEIIMSYEVPRGPITQWVQQDQLIPLLDGLDEVNASVLPDCIKAINTYKQQHLVPLVVCCRTGDYDAHHLLALQNAVVIQPLKEDQIDAYFKAAGKSLAGIRSVLRKNAELRELVRTPLMLHIVTQAYQGVSVQVLPKKGTMQEQQQHIFHQYIERMLTLPYVRFSPLSIIQWLSWLAKQMRTHNLAVFYLEQLQPEWLPDGRIQWIYELLAVRLYGIIVGILVCILITAAFFGANTLPNIICYGLVGGLIGGLISGSGPVALWSSTSVEGRRKKGKRLGLLCVSSAVFIGVGIGYINTLADTIHLYGYIFEINTGLCVFLLMSIIEAGRRRTRSPGTLRRQNPQWWIRWLPGLHINHLKFCIFVGLLLGFNSGLSYGLSYAMHDGLISGRSHGLTYLVHDGLAYGSVSIVLSLLLLNLKRNVVLTEAIAWSTNPLSRSLFRIAHLKRTFRLFMLASFSFGATYSLITSAFVHPLIGLLYGVKTGVIGGLSISLVYWILLELWNSFSQEVLDDRCRSTPNQGVRKSVQNGIFLGLMGPTGYATRCKQASIEMESDFLRRKGQRVAY